MLKPKLLEPEILTRPTIFTPSQWLPFDWYDWLPRFPRYAPNPYLMSPLSFFFAHIAWHSRYQTKFPHSLKYRLNRAIAVNNLQQVSQILQKGFPIDEPIEQKYGYNSLQIAAINNNHPLIEILSLRGADLNKKDRWGNTPLHLAIVNQNHEAIHSLMKNGSDPSLSNNYGLSSFDKAANNPNILSFIQGYDRSIRKFPKFRVKLKFQQRLHNPFWKSLSSMKIYSGKVRQHLMSKWQFDFTDSNTVEEVMEGRKNINDLQFKK